ncbi:hypothetical protein M0802_015309 [Mischocyttarus mexicanus]|nr:hypothetical protein M0802_015309 [Mischocyttarus mexicanus]
MSTVVLGRDVLRKCGFRMSRKSICSEEEVTISQIINIEIDNGMISERECNKLKLDENSEFAAKKRNR